LQHVWCGTDIKGYVYFGIEGALEVVMNWCDVVGHGDVICDTEAFAVSPISENAWEI
jgi:hypothetical protein